MTIKQFAVHVVKIFGCERKLFLTGEIGCQVIDFPHYAKINVHTFVKGCVYRGNRLLHVDALIFHLYYAVCWQNSQEQHFFTVIVICGVHAVMLLVYYKLMVQKNQIG